MLATHAHQANLPVVATHTVDYLLPEQAYLQRLVGSIRLNRPINDLPETAASLPQAYFLPVEELEKRFSTFPGALQNSHQVAERCNGYPPLDQPHYPILQDLGYETSESLLRRKAIEGAVHLYRQITPEIQERLDHELTSINHRGYADLFLIMQEIIEFAHRSGIPTASRGSWVIRAFCETLPRSPSQF